MTLTVHFLYKCLVSKYESKTRTQRVFWIPNDMNKRLKRFAKKAGLTSAAVVRLALAKYLKMSESKS